MTENNSNQAFSDENLRHIAKQKVDFRFSVKIHLGIFVIVNILLLAINLIWTPLIYWIIFPFFGWLIGFVLHSVAYSLYAKGVYPIAKRGVIFHAVSYVFVNLYLFIINFYTVPGFYWVFFPVFFWGVALIMHCIAYLVYFRGKVDEEGEGRPRREQAIEKEIEKMRRRMNK